MKRIAYLLHRFPAITDTFIKREIRSLQKAGTEVQVISVWTPDKTETTAEILAEWAADTKFILPRSSFSTLRILFAWMNHSPRRVFTTLRLALSTSRPGWRGFTYQTFYFAEALLAADILRRDAVDHVHNHIGDQSGTVTMLAAKLAGIGYSITFHGWPVFFDAEYSRIKEKVLAAEFTRSISYFCRSQLMMFSGREDPASFKIVHCGLNIEKYDYRPPRERVARLFCAARLSPEKGQTFIIEALKILHQRGYPLELRLAGDGPSRARLKSLSEERQIAEYVNFLGNLTEDQVISELQASDLFMLSSFVEGVPVSAMEAMAVGVPVIATNVGGTGELVEDGRTGVLVRPSDPKALADAVARLIEDYPLRLHIARFGRQRVLEEFDVERETAKLNGYLLESCCLQHPAC